MAHPMKGACTDKKARLARYANGGAVSVAGHSRAPKGAKVKGYADGGLVEGLAAGGMDAMPRSDRAQRGAKPNVTNVNITMAPKAEPPLPAVPPPMPPVAAAPPPPMPPMGPAGPMPPMKNGGPVTRFKDGGAVKGKMAPLFGKDAKKAKPAPVRKNFGGMVPGVMPVDPPTMLAPAPGNAVAGVMPPMGGVPGVMPAGASPMGRQTGGAFNVMPGPMGGNKMGPIARPSPAMPPPGGGGMNSNAMNRPVGVGGPGGAPVNHLAHAQRRAFLADGLQGEQLRSAMGALRGTGAFRGGRNMGGPGAGGGMFKDGGKVKPRSMDVVSTSDDLPVKSMNAEIVPQKGMEGLKPIPMPQAKKSGGKVKKPKKGK